MTKLCALFAGKHHGITYFFVWVDVDPGVRSGDRFGFKTLQALVTARTFFRYDMQPHNVVVVTSANLRLWIFKLVHYCC